MNNSISIKQLTPDLYSTYIEVGTIAYNQHYLHLWKNNDSTPYIENSFTEVVLFKEEEDSNTELFVIFSNEIPTGILKFSKDKPIGDYSKKDALLLDKIYFLKEYSGKGLGKEVLDFVLNQARFLNKKIIWLDTMKNGPALKFYMKNGFEIHSEKDHYSDLVIKEERPMYNMVKRL